MLKFYYLIGQLTKIYETSNEEKGDNHKICDDIVKLIKKWEVNANK